MKRKNNSIWILGVSAAVAGLILTGCGDAGTTTDAATTVETEAAGAPSEEEEETCTTLDPNVKLNFINAGGTESDAIQLGYIDPFTASTGISVTLNPPNDLGRLQAEVESGNVTVDLFSTESTTSEQAIAEGLFEPLDTTRADFAPALPGAITEFTYGFQYYSTIMGWRDEAVQGGTGPATWAEFFDTEKFPGRRGLADYPAFTIPVALLADGVAPADLYPLDVDRAFNFLDKNKESIDIWWEAGAQPPELLASGELDYSMVWSGRIVLVPEDQGLRYSFDQGLLDLAVIGIPKGAPNYCEALAFLATVSQPENQAAAATILPYTGGAEGIDQFLPTDNLDIFPTSEANLSKQVVQDPKWWFENGSEVQKRWEEYKLSR